MKTYFVKLTYEILQIENLTATDKIILARRLGWGKKPYFEKVKTLAAVLNMPLKTVQKSITKLKRLGYWPQTTTPSREGDEPARGGNLPSRGGSLPTGGGDVPPRGGDKKSVSPLKAEALLDSSLDIKLEKNKKEGLESAAGASPLCDQPQTSFKKKGEEDSVSSEPHEIKISTTTGSEAPSKDCHPSVAPSAPPLGPDGRPMAKADMEAENLRAFFSGQPEPYTAAQVAAGVARVSTTEELEREFSSLFKKRAV